MDKFETLFGIKKSEVRPTCILMPFLRRYILKGFGATSLSRGKLYGATSNSSSTLIHTGVGAAALGDAVLYLGETACKEIMLLGSCGLIDNSKNLGIGSVVSPSVAYEAESFTQLLQQDDRDWKTFYPDRNLYQSFLKESGALDTKEATCLTVGSLRLEEEKLDLLRGRGIQVVDMECSSLFSACGYIGRRSLALLCVTDIVGSKPFYAKLDNSENSAVSNSFKKAIDTLCDFIKKRPIS